MSHTIAVRIGAAALAFLLNGCAAVTTLGTTHEDELQKLYTGQPRAEVLKLLGAPALQQALSNGWSQERHELRLRDDDSAMFSIVDVMTLGTLSMGESLSGRPRNPVYLITTLYDRDARLVCARATRKSRENHMFKRMLPADGTITGRCPA